MELSRQEYPALLVSDSSNYKEHVNIRADCLRRARFRPIKQYLSWKSGSS